MLPLIALVFLLLLIACVKRHQRAQLGWYTVKLQEVEENNHKLLKDVIKHEKHHAEREASRRQSRMRHLMEMEAMQLRLETQMEGLARGLDDEDREERAKPSRAGSASSSQGARQSSSATRPTVLEPDGGAGERSKSARERPRPKKSLFSVANLFSTHHPAPAPAASAPLPTRAWQCPRAKGSVDSILRAPGSARLPDGELAVSARLPSAGRPMHECVRSKWLS